MTTATQVLDAARSQIGTVEARDGSTPYHRAYGLPFSQPWCAVFVWDCFRRAAAPKLTHPRTAYTPTLAQWFRDRNAFTPGGPRPGDLVFYNWPDSLNRIQHVGLVEHVEPNAVVTIEGNTSSGTGGSQSNGGGVWRRRRARNASIVGYGHPAYTPAEDDDMPLTPHDLDAIAERVWGQAVRNGWGDVVRADQILAGSEIRAGAVQAQLQEVSEQVGRLTVAGVDADTIADAVAAGLARRLNPEVTAHP